MRVRLRPLRLRGLLCQPPLLHEAVGEWRARSGECGSCWSARRARRAKEALKRGGRRKALSALNSALSACTKKKAVLSTFLLGGRSGAFTVLPFNLLPTSLTMSTSCLSSFLPANNPSRASPFDHHHRMQAVTKASLVTAIILLGCAPTVMCGVVSANTIVDSLHVGGRSPRSSTPCDHHGRP